MTVQVSASEAETISAGRALAPDLAPGDVLLVEGPLGAGKTAFIRGLAGGLGCDEADVSSPTFTLVQEYRGRLRLQHADLYRLSPREVEDLGLEDYLDDSVLAVEWPDRWHEAPAGAFRVTIEPLDGTARRITVAPGVR